MRKLLIISLLSSLLISCDKGTETRIASESQPENRKIIHSENALLVTGDGIRITAGDYEYVRKLLNPEAKKFFASHPEDLLERIINRRLVIKYLEDSGLAKEYGLDEKMEEFKKEYLSRYYVSTEAGKRAKTVTEGDIVKRFKELFPGKDPSKMTEGDRKFIRNELSVKFYDRAVEETYNEIRKKVQFKKDGKTLIASCCGIELKTPIGKDEKKTKEKLTRKFLTEYFYRKAVEKGYDKDPEFQRTFTEYFATKAINIFRKELKKRIKVSEEEIKEFYEKNKDKFMMPEKAQAVVLYFNSKDKAIEAKKELSSNRWEKVARRFGRFNAKPRYYYNDPKDPIGTLIFMGGNKEKVIVADLGKNRFVVVKILRIVPQKRITLTEAKNYIKLRLSREKLREKEKEFLKELKRKYHIKVQRENLSCIN
jgi:hypothetical protein